LEFDVNEQARRGPVKRWAILQCASGADNAIRMCSFISGTAYKAAEKSLELRMGVAQGLKPDAI
jgi:hypothetical protein